MTTRSVKIADLVYYMKRPLASMKRLPDDKGDWLAGAGRVVSIYDMDGDLHTKGSVPVNNIKTIKVCPSPDVDHHDCDLISLSLGEFTYSQKNFLLNLLA